MVIGKVVIPFAVVLCVATAQAAEPPIPCDPAAQLNRDLKRRRFHDAMRLLEPVRLHLKKADAGAWNRAYQRTLKLTASMGQNEWPAILADPAIPLRFKHALVDRIDRAAGGDHRGKSSPPIDRPKAHAQFNASVRLRDALDRKRFGLALRLLKRV